MRYGCSDCGEIITLRLLHHPAQGAPCQLDLCGAMLCYGLLSELFQYHTRCCLSCHVHKDKQQHFFSVFGKKVMIAGRAF